MNTKQQKQMILLEIKNLVCIMTKRQDDTLDFYLQKCKLDIDRVEVDCCIDFRALYSYNLGTNYYMNRGGDYVNDDVIVLMFKIHDDIDSLYSDGLRQND